jgi:photosystem II stability/assembly factor-like uncharacterized protein
MKRIFFLFVLLLIAGFETGCTGSGAVTPLTPTKASEADTSTTADSDVIYWTSFPVTFTLTDGLNGVFLLNKKLGWACGNNGVVLRYDGDSWDKVDTGLAKNENLMAVAFINETEGWIVGTHGVILHYNNGSWSLDSSQTEETLYSIAITPSHTAWVVGSNGTILTYNGISWGSISAVSAAAGASTTVTSDIYSIGMSDQNNGWAVGNLGLILRYDGQKWTTYAASPSTERLNSVSVINDVQAWVVGAYGTILRFNGTAWSKIVSAFSGFDLYQVFMKSDDDGWATGQDGTLIYYDGSRWISHQKPEGKPSLNSVAFYKDLGFIVGANGTILKFQPNGEMTKFSFLFKGNVAKQPSKTVPYWTLTYTLMNQSPKASPLMTYELSIPKGFEAYQPKATPTPAGAAVPTGSPVPSPIATVSPANTAPSDAATVASSGKAGAGPSSTGTPPSGGNSSKTAGVVIGSWKMKGDDLEWEIGNVASSELKTVTVLLQEKKGEKKEYPVLLKAFLVSIDKVLAEAAPVTLLASEPTENATPDSESTPAAKGTVLTVPAKNPVSQEVDVDEDASESGAPNAQPAPTPGH